MLGATEMITPILLLADLAAIVVVASMFYRRHARRDFLVSLLMANLGVLGITAVLHTADLSVGVGMGLFGVLAIVRLRSSELTQIEVAYFFTALAMGLIAGLPTSATWLQAALIAGLFLGLWAVDHPGLAPGTVHVKAKLPEFYTNEAKARRTLERACGQRVKSLRIVRADLASGTTLVDAHLEAEVTQPVESDRMPAQPLSQAPAGVLADASAATPAEGEAPLTFGLTEAQRPADADLGVQLQRAEVHALRPHLGPDRAVSPS